MKNKKKIAACVSIGIVICIIFLGGLLNDIIQQRGLEEKESWRLVENINSNAVIVNGRVESEEYPYGYNVGVIEDDKVGKAVLVTPGTSIEINGMITKDTSLCISYEIHPWVKNETDGAYLNIDIVSEDESQNYVYKVNSKIQTQMIPLEKFENSEIQVKIYVSNEEGLNENCDWVILKKFAFLEEGFEEKGIQFFDGGYVKSATYFADEWPLNFWNSEMDNLSSDLKQIKEDGFDSIILIIPWREFQTTISPIAYNDYAFQKLDEIMKEAMEADLGVYTRIGYTWDYYDDSNENIVDRFCSLMGDLALQEAWYDYINKMYVTLRAYDNFREGFLTWEDFWNNLAMCDEVDEKARLEKAAFIGYQKWIEDNYSVDDYNNKYGTAYDSFLEIPVPRREEPAMEAMYMFYDNFLNNLLEESQERFPNLSMEVRMDWDVIYKLDGSKDYYKHTNTFSCMDSIFTTTMYGIPMGFENIGERVGFEEALEKTEYILKNFKLQNGNKPVYIDQFIFADNTPKFVNNAQIREEEVNDYLKNVANILLEYSEGYGIWTYRNYCANMLFNSQFALGEVEWDRDGGVLFEAEDDSLVCKLDKGGSIRQEVPEIRNHFDADEYIFEFEITKLDEEGVLSVTIGDDERILEIMDIGKVSLVFPKGIDFNVMIESKDCKLSIDNLKLYSQIQQGYLYDESNERLQCLTGLQELNKRLK